MKTEAELNKQIEEIERLVKRLKIDIKERSDQPSPKDRKLKIGDEVYIINPKPNQEKEGTITKISAFRSTVITKKGKVVRAHKNLVKK